MYSSYFSEYIHTYVNEHIKPNLRAIGKEP